MQFGGSHNTVKSPVVSAKAYNRVIRNYDNKALVLPRDSCNKKIKQKQKS